MPRRMTEQEIELHLEKAEAVDSHEYGSLDDDDYFTATLYRTETNRHFRYVESTGMTADPRAGSADWLDDSELGAWKEF